MSAANAHEVVTTARDMADLIPLPAGGRHPDPVNYRAWEDLMLAAAGALARKTGYDRDLLSVAVGPKLEVGMNPPWRALLLIAQSAAEARQHARADFAGERRPALRSIVAFG
jgi:hypothetical protein